MEALKARLTAVETDIRDVKGVVGRIEKILERMEAGQRAMEKDVAELKGRVAQLPSTVQLLGFVLAVLALAGVGKYFL